MALSPKQKGSAERIYCGEAFCDKPQHASHNIDTSTGTACNFSSNGVTRSWSCNTRQWATLLPTAAWSWRRTKGHPVIFHPVRHSTLAQFPKIAPCHQKSRQSQSHCAQPICCKAFTTRLPAELLALHPGVLSGPTSDGLQRAQPGQ